MTYISILDHFDIEMHRYWKSLQKPLIEWTRFSPMPQYRDNKGIKNDIDIQEQRRWEMVAAIKGCQQNSGRWKSDDLSAPRKLNLVLQQGSPKSSKMVQSKGGCRDLGIRGASERGEGGPETLPKTRRKRLHDPAEMKPLGSSILHPMPGWVGWGGVTWKPRV